MGPIRSGGKKISAKYDIWDEILDTLEQSVGDGAGGLTMRRITYDGCQEGG